MKAVEKVFFALIRFEINKTALCDEVKNLITPEILPSLFTLSKRHDLAHLICDALEKNGLLFDGEIKARFLNERLLAVCRYERQKYEFDRICIVLEEAEIPFIPLKGSVIRAFYPEPWMRTSCDIDILVEPKNLSCAVNVLQKELEYKKKEFESSHDVSLFSASGVHLELHHSLVEENRTKRAEDILYSVWDSVVDDISFKKTLKDDMFYFYHVAHMAKHFEVGGCGVRTFLDVYLLKEQERYKTCECDKLLERGNLLAFSKGVEETALAWFKEAQSTPLVESIQEFILNAGMYADMENKAAINQAKRGGRTKYFCSRLFLSREELVKQYPKLENKKWLMLFYQM